MTNLNQSVLLVYSPKKKSNWYSKGVLRRRVDCTPPSSITVDVDNNYGAGQWIRMMVEVRSFAWRHVQKLCTMKISSGKSSVFVPEPCIDRLLLSIDQSAWVQEAGGRGSINLVQIKGQNTDWQSMNNYWGAAWELANCPEPPLDLRVVADSGQEVSYSNLTPLKSLKTRTVSAASSYISLVELN